MNENDVMASNIQPRETSVRPMSQQGAQSPRTGDWDKGARARNGSTLLGDGAKKISGLGDSELAVGEVEGEEYSEPPPTGETQLDFKSLHAEVGQESTEAGEEYEYLEASPQQLATESGEEGAAELDSQMLKEAGAAIETGQAPQEEFFPLLAALVPTLISAAGPALAKGVMRKLTPRAKTVLKRIPKPVVGAIGGIAKTAVGSALKRAGGNNVLGLVAKLLESAEQSPATESGMEVDEALVNEAALAIESIVDYDDREWITATSQIPWRRVCALRITFPTGNMYRGTGFLISARAVVTAGHCVYLEKERGWARQIEVIPGCNGTKRPFGQAITTSFRSVEGWVTNKKPESDYGCIILPTNAFKGNSLGSFGFASFDGKQLLAQEAELGGYPADKSFAELWRAKRFLKTVTSTTLIYNIATMGGQSGAPIHIVRNGARYVVGIHNYGGATGNSATRITAPVYQNLYKWSRI